MLRGRFCNWKPAIKEILNTGEIWLKSNLFPALQGRENANTGTKPRNRFIPQVMPNWACPLFLPHGLQGPVSILPSYLPTQAAASMVCSQPGYLGEKTTHKGDAPVSEIPTAFSFSTFSFSSASSAPLCQPSSPTSVPPEGI